MQKKKTKSKQKKLYISKVLEVKRIKFLSFANRCIWRDLHAHPMWEGSAVMWNSFPCPTRTTNKDTMGFSECLTKWTQVRAKYTWWTVREHNHFMMSTFKEHILYGFWRVLFADKNFKKSKLGFNSLVFLIFLKQWNTILLLGIPREDETM